MITQTLINLFRGDSQIQSLMGTQDPSSAPVYLANSYSEEKDIQIVVDYVLGETSSIDADLVTGEIAVDVYVKVSTPNSEEIMHQIVKRILDLVDLRGSQLNDLYTSTVYRIKKVDSSYTFDDSSMSHVTSIIFAFVCSFQ